MRYDSELAATAELKPGTVALDVSIEVEGIQWRRLMIKTHVVQPGEDIAEVIASYVTPYIQTGDIIFISEKCTAIAERRLVDINSVKPRFWARFLAARIKRTPFGRGLGMAPTMEVAFQQAGTLRMLLAAAAGFVGKLLGRSGDFYRIAGPRVKAIDGPTTWAQPPFNQYIILGPENPEHTAQRAAGLLAERLKARELAGNGAAMPARPGDSNGSRLPIGVAVVDVNDLGSEVLGASAGVNIELVAEALRDNPLGQGAYQTPLGILRKVN